MKQLLLLMFISVLALNVFSQISYEERVEIVRGGDYSGYEIYEFGEHGLLMRSYATEDVNDETEWKFELINTDLELEHEESVMLGDRMYDDESFITDNFYHNLFKDRKGNYTLISIDINSFDVYRVDGILPKRTYISDMAVLGDFAYFKSRVKRNSFMFSLNWKTGDKNTIPISIQGVKPKSIVFENFQLLEESNEIFLYLKVRIDKHNNDMYVMRLNENGEKESLFNLNKEIEENIINITAFAMDDGQYVFSGTYDEYGGSSSIGIFFCEANDSKISYIEFYKFLDLENFLNYLPERRKEKIEKKKKKKEAKGKEYDLNYNITMHDIIHIEDGYILLGEAFYPTYRTESYTTTSTINGVTTTTTQYRTVFDGYQYTHAFIARFGMDGSMEWNQCFELWSTYKTWYEKKHISIQQRNANSIKLVFPSSNKIVYKEIDFGGKILHDKESDEIETGYDDKEIRYTISNLDYWYDNYFVAYGTQKIKEKENGKKTKKFIFYISKVLFQ